MFCTFIVVLPRSLKRLSVFDTRDRGGLFSRGIRENYMGVMLTHKVLTCQNVPHASCGLSVRPHLCRDTGITRRAINQTKENHNIPQLMPQRSPANRNWTYRLGLSYHIHAKSSMPRGLQSTRGSKRNRPTLFSTFNFCNAGMNTGGAVTTRVHSRLQRQHPHG